MTIAELAAMTGQSESDATAFVKCLRMWMDKGYNMEQAIEKHMSQMTRLLNNATKVPVSIVVDAFYG